MKSRTVNRPIYASRKKVIFALAQTPNQELERSRLLEQTALDPHTLSATCKFLISRNCLTRFPVTGYKGRCHRVKYRLDYKDNKDIYSILNSWAKRKRDATDRRQREQWELAFATLIDNQQKFWKIHCKEIDWVRCNAGRLEVMMCRRRYNWFMCLIHLMRVLGAREALSVFLDKLTHLSVREFEMYTNNHAYSLRMRRATRIAYFSQLANKLVDEDIASGDTNLYPAGPTTIANYLETLLGLQQKTTWEEMHKLGYA